MNEPALWRLELIHDLDDQGWSASRIAAEVNSSASVVRRWLNTERLNPRLTDPVKVDRAIAGHLHHRELTLFELDLFLRAVADRLPELEERSPDDGTCEGRRRYGDRRWQGIRSMIRTRGLDQR